MTTEHDLKIGTRIHLIGDCKRTGDTGIWAGAIRCRCRIARRSINAVAQLIYVTSDRPAIGKNSAASDLVRCTVTWGKWMELKPLLLLNKAGVVARPIIENVASIWKAGDLNAAAVAT